MHTNAVRHTCCHVEITVVAAVGKLKPSAATHLWTSDKHWLRMLGLSVVSQPVNAQLQAILSFARYTYVSFVSSDLGVIGCAQSIKGYAKCRSCGYGTGPVAKKPKVREQSVGIEKHHTYQAKYQYLYSQVVCTPTFLSNV
jgi:hypothetical protein